MHKGNDYWFEDGWLWWRHYAACGYVWRDEELATCYVVEVSFN